MTRERTYDMSKKKDRIDFTYDLAVELMKEGNKGSYYFYNINDIRPYEVIYDSYENLSYDNLVGVRATNFDNGLAMLGLLSIVMTYQYNHIKEKLSKKGAIDMAMAYEYEDNAYYDDLPNMTFADIKHIMVLDMSDSEEYRVFPSLAAVRRETPNHEKPLIWTGTDLFNAIHEMLN